MQTVLSWNLILRRFGGFPQRSGETNNRERRRLSAHEVFDVIQRVDRRLRCVSGSVWITDGGGSDTILAGGDTYLVRKGRKTIVEALEASVVEF